LTRRVCATWQASLRLEHQLAKYEEAIAAERAKLAAMDAERGRAMEDEKAKLVAAMAETVERTMDAEAAKMRASLAAERTSLEAERASLLETKVSASVVDAHIGTADAQDAQMVHGSEGTRKSHRAAQASDDGESTADRAERAEAEERLAECLVEVEGLRAAHEAMQTELETARKREEALKATHPSSVPPLSSALAGEQQQRSAVKLLAMATQRRDLAAKHADASEQRASRREELARRRQRLQQERLELQAAQDALGRSAGACVSAGLACAAQCATAKDATTLRASSDDASNDYAPLPQSTTAHASVTAAPAGTRVASHVPPAVTMSPRRCPLPPVVATSPRISSPLAVVSVRTPTTPTVWPAAVPTVSTANSSSAPAACVSVTSATTIPSSSAPDDAMTYEANATLEHRPSRSAPLVEAMPDATVPPAPRTSLFEAPAAASKPASKPPDVEAPILDERSSHTTSSLQLSPRLQLSRKDGLAHEHLHRGSSSWQPARQRLAPVARAARVVPTGPHYRAPPAGPHEPVVRTATRSPRGQATNRRAPPGSGVSMDRMDASSPAEVVRVADGEAVEFGSMQPPADPDDGDE
jgi:hypothetical protein